MNKLLLILILLTDVAVFTLYVTQIKVTAFTLHCLSEITRTIRDSTEAHRINNKRITRLEREILE